MRADAGRGGAPAGLAATMLAGLVQEHERAVGAWQAEWPVIAEALQATGAALEAMADVIAGLDGRSARMRANLDATGGAIFAERVVMLAAPVLGRSAAHQLLRGAARSQASGQSLGRRSSALPAIARRRRDARRSLAASIARAPTWAPPRRSGSAC